MTPVPDSEFSRFAQDSASSVDNRFEATVVWMSEQALVPGRQYLFKQTTKVVPGAVSTLRYRIDVNTLHRQEAPGLALNEIGRCAITLTEPIMHEIPFGVAQLLRNYKPLVM